MRRQRQRRGRIGRGLQFHEVEVERSRIVKHPVQDEGAGVVAVADHRSPDRPSSDRFDRIAALDADDLLALLHLGELDAVLVKPRVEAARFRDDDVRRVGVAIGESPGDAAVAAGHNKGNPGQGHPGDAAWLAPDILNGFWVHRSRFKV